MPRTGVCLMSRSVLAVCGLLFVCVLVVYSCGGSMSNPLQQGRPALSVTVTDTPPAGVSVSSIEGRVTGGTLDPGSVGMKAGPGAEEMQTENVETGRGLLNEGREESGTYTRTSCS